MTGFDIETGDNAAVVNRDGVLNIGKTIFDIGCQIGKNIRKLVFG